MIIDQSEIDALLSQATGLAEEAGDLLTPTEAPAAVAEAPPPAVDLPGDPEVKRILRLTVPVVVQLATRQMAIAAVRDLSVGAIIEFEKSLEEPLDLLVNNRLIGHGQCVKVGENFGLRVTKVTSRAQRIRSLG